MCIRDRICPEEVALAACQLLSVHIGVEREDLLRETARQFGIQRLGANVRASLDEGIDFLLLTDRATQRGTTVTARIP